MSEGKRDTDSATGQSPDGLLPRLLETISSGHFAPGQRISESELARQLGVSRGPIREALGRLEGRVVERRPNLGVRLIEMDREKLEELFRVREALEGMAARLAAENSTNTDLQRLTGLLEQHERVIQGDAQGGYLQGIGDEDFHVSIVSASGCGTLKRILMDEVYFQLRLHRRRSGTQPGRARAALSEHRAIVDALYARNPERAEIAMREHLRSARFSALGALEE
ncbi:GntR family transcriptional regulator [Roseovarius sp. SK2]|jgi:DNA-binding GntR family transcriptional regulator|uniref:GntR family transcriptional regulator n=1 Tax=Roseovarius TaxID=74030 RepID=UPI000CDCEF33|nr:MULTISPECIES: GntR family transcriptional regulator [Roseovarius]MDD9725704.1 GntR family transcriptional regulator [Roseovarius sp. SK2]